MNNHMKRSKMKRNEKDELLEEEADVQTSDESPEGETTGKKENSAS